MSAKSGSLATQVSAVITQHQNDKNVSLIGCETITETGKEFLRKTSRCHKHVSTKKLNQSIHINMIKLEKTILLNREKKDLSHF